MSSKMPPPLATSVEELEELVKLMDESPDAAVRLQAAVDILELADGPVEGSAAERQSMEINDA